MAELVAANMAEAALSNGWSGGDPFSPSAALTGWPQAAALASGGFVILYWNSDSSDPDSPGSPLRAQIHSASGAEIGPELQLPSPKDGNLHHYQVAGLPGGGFVVCYTVTTDHGPGIELGHELFIQRYDGEGTPVGEPVQVNTSEDGPQFSPNIAVLDNGGFVITWDDPNGNWPNQDGGVKGQLFTPEGARSGSEFVVPPTFVMMQRYHEVAALPGGGFVAAWIEDTNDPKVMAQIFDGSANRVGAAFAIDAPDSGYVFLPEIVALSGGGFVAVWTATDGLGDASILGRLFTSAGVAVGEAFAVSNGTTGGRNSPNVVALRDGGFAVTWNDSSGDGSGSAVLGRFFDSAGTKVGDEFVVNAPTAEDQRGPVAVALAWGGFAVAWADYGGETPANSSTVAARIFSPDGFDARNDALATDEATAIGGNIFADHGGGADVAPAAGLLWVAEVNGSAADVGREIALDSGALLTLNSDGSYSYDPNGAFDALAAQGTGGSNSQGSDSFTYRLAGGDTATVTIAIGGLWSAPHVVLGTSGVDQLNGTGLADRLEGGLSNDTLNGNGGDDSLVGGGGSDVLNGGDGSDVALYSYAASGGGEKVLRFIPVNGGDVRDFNVQEMTTQPSGDNIWFSFQTVFQVRFTGSTIVVTGAGSASHLGTDTLSGVEALRFAIEGETGSSIELNPVAALLGGPGDDRMDGTIGRDAMDGGAGHDWIDGKDGSDSLRGGEGDDILLSGAGLDSLSGGAGDDILYFGPDFRLGSSIDRVDGGSGTDQMILQGFYYFSAFAGSDLFQGIERLVLLPEHDTRYGPARADTFYNIELSSDAMIAAGGTFTIDGSALVEGWTFDGAGETDGTYALIGGAGADTLLTGAGPDVIDGRGGADEMTGRLGNDVYYVDNAGDQVIELAGEGTDEIRTALASFSLVGLANVENLSASSDSAHDFRGNSGNNVVTGGGGADVLRLHDGGDDTVLAGAGNDNIFFIGALTAADVVNGGSGTDTLILQGAYGALALSANLTQIENVSILAGSNINFGEPGTNRYDYALTINDSNFAAGVQARINGAALLAGEDFTFDGSAETDALFVVYGGKGKDTLTGGQGNDIFFYAEERFASGDTVNGGNGYDGMFLRGNYTIDFTAPGYTGLFTSIENLTLTSATDERYARGGGTEFAYNLTLSDAIVNAGQTLTVSGALLLATETMVLDASAENDGALRLFGGKANDTLKGGGQNDLIHGNLGADILAGNGGADVFRYQDVAESNFQSMDQIRDFVQGADKIDLSRIDSNVHVAGDQPFAWIGSSAFSGSAGELKAEHLGGSDWLVQGDTDGNGLADFVIMVTATPTATFGTSDFIL